LNKSSNHWSLKDQNPRAAYNAIGGHQNIFKEAQNLYTNEPSLYQSNTSFNTTKNGAVMEFKRKSVPDDSYNLLNEFYY